MKTYAERRAAAPIPSPARHQTRNLTARASDYRTEAIATLMQGRRRSAVLCFAFLAWLIVSIPRIGFAQAPAGNAGVFVGIQEYDDPVITGLNYSVNDAIEMAYLFVVECRLIQPRNCRLLITNPPKEDTLVATHFQILTEAIKKDTGVDWVLERNRPTSRRIGRTVVEAAAIGQESTDVFLCWLTSHGFYDDGAYIYPADGDSNPRLRRRLGVQVQELEADLLSSSAGHKLFFINACQTRPEPVAQFVSTSNIFGTANDPDYYEKLSRPAAGVCKFMSCSSGEASYETSEFQHSVFTYYLLDAIRNGNPGLGGRLDLEFISKRVRRNVAAWSESHSTTQRRYQQTPQLVIGNGAASVSKGFVFPRSDSMRALLEFLRYDGPNCPETTLAIRVLENYDSASTTDLEVARATRKRMNGHYDDFDFSSRVKHILARSKVAPAIELPLDKSSASGQERESGLRSSENSRDTGESDKLDSQYRNAMYYLSHIHENTDREIGRQRFLVGLAGLEMAADDGHAEAINSIGALGVFWLRTLVQHSDHPDFATKIRPISQPTEFEGSRPFIIGRSYEDSVPPISDAYSDVAARFKEGMARGSEMAALNYAYCQLNGFIPGQGAQDAYNTLIKVAKTGENGEACRHLGCFCRLALFTKYPSAQDRLVALNDRNNELRREAEEWFTRGMLFGDSEPSQPETSVWYSRSVSHDVNIRGQDRAVSLPLFNWQFPQTEEFVPNDSDLAKLLTSEQKRAMSDDLLDFLGSE